MYARFFHKVMRDEGLIESDEPFANLLTQGMVLNETFYREDENGSATYYSPAEVEMERDDKGRVTGAKLRADGERVTVGRLEKMSKSRNNGIDPEAMVGRYGADTIRLYMMMQSPPHQTLEWSDNRGRGSIPVPAAAVAHGGGPCGRGTRGRSRSGAARPGPARRVAQDPRDHRQGR